MLELNTPPLLCPRCQHREIGFTLLQGHQDNWFVHTQCLNCKDFILWELPSSTNMDDADNWMPEDLTGLQQEWTEWFQWKQRHLYSQNSTATHTKRSWFLVVCIVGGLLFYLADQYHLLGIFFEDVDVRKQWIKRYAYQLERSPCLSEEMKYKIRSVPILYTSEGVYKHGNLQFGEAGYYWGEEKIKIYRSNFWFYGQPKKSQLIETLIHELRHRASPALGHSDTFYQLVQRDTQCVLRHWHD